MKHHPDCECRECREREGKRFAVWLVAIGLMMAAVLVMFSGCTGPVVPHPVESQSASFDGNEQNSGIIGVVPGGYQITPHFRDRYNEMVEEYGGRFMPALRKDDGITVTHLLSDPPRVLLVIDKEHMVKAWQMNVWRKTERPR